MSNTEMIRELRALTQAGMKDCKDALVESNWDLQKAVDLIKVKGLNVVSGREGKVAAEGRVVIISAADRELAVMVEVNCQTDFVAASPDFVRFSETTAATLMGSVLHSDIFSVNDVEELRKEVIATTKENILVRRWWAEEGQDPTVRLFSYMHSNNKIGVLLTMKAPTIEAADSNDFRLLGEELAMQIAAMSPLAVSQDRLSPADVERQKAIFETQLIELNKPQAAWPKIMEGKLNKWYTEVCLLKQESVVVPKSTVEQVVKSVGAKLGGEVQVVNFIRCQVGEGIEVKKDNLADEVAKMVV